MLRDSSLHPVERTTRPYGDTLVLLVAETTPASTRGRRLRLRRRRAEAVVESPPGAPRRTAYLYLAPALLAFGLFALVPTLHSFYISFFDWNGVTEGKFVGFDNYTAIISDDRLRGSFSHTLVLIAFFSVLPIALGLVLAAALTRVRVRGMTGFRVLLFLPQILPAVVVAVVWTMIYVPDGGPLNAFLGGIGLGALQQDWLGDFTLALPSVGIIGSWVEIGLCMVLFIAGIQQIPGSLYDAARVEGAGPVREFLAVTLPGLRNQVVVAGVLTLTGALRTFDLIYLLTRGGPGDSTTVPAYLVYDLAFQKSRVGAAAAVGVVLAALILLISVSVIRFSESRE